MNKQFMISKSQAAILIVAMGGNGTLTELKEAWMQFAQAENTLDELILSATQEELDAICMGETSDSHSPCD